MQYSREVDEMVCVKKGPNHGPAPIPEEGKWVQAKEIKDINLGFRQDCNMYCCPLQVKANSLDLPFVMEIEKSATYR